MNEQANKFDYPKLYRVILRGFGGYVTGINYKISYVIAANPDHAYKKVREFLDTKDYGFRNDRALDKVELMAENYEYSETQTMLFL
jgi:hypothetical protein